MPQLMFQIGEAAQLVGITPKTIRHYHAIGLLPDPVRAPNHYRLYSVAHLEQLQRIVRLKAIGLSLKQIKAICAAPDPDATLRSTLHQQAQRIRDEIDELHHTLLDIEAYLEADTPAVSSGPVNVLPTSAMEIVTETVKRQSSGLADVLLELDGPTLAKVDEYHWSAGYVRYWQATAAHLAEADSLFIFWIERYLALRTMSPDDLQGSAWLRELHASPERAGIAARLFYAPLLSSFNAKEQDALRKLVLSLQLQHASPLQRQFLGLLLRA